MTFLLDNLLYGLAIAVPGVIIGGGIAYLTSPRTRTRRRP